MYKYYDNKLKRTTINIAPGEYYATDEDIIINTILGSCVAVALYDPVRRIAGLNHFMLAESKFKKPDESFIKIERYGLYAMEALINTIIKQGGSKHRLRAKIFGGSRILKTNEKIDIGMQNILFAERYLETEGIPLLRSDTGGDRARRIYLFPQTFRVLLRRVYPTTELDLMMKKYLEKLGKDQDDRGKAVLFQ